MTSFLRPHADIPMRPTDKDTEVFDLEELFNQYVETDHVHFSDNTAEPSSSDELAHLFELPSSNGSDHPIEASPMPIWDPSSEDSWHQALSTFNQNAALPTFPVQSSSIYPESRGKGSQSDPNLLYFDDLFEIDEPQPRRSLSRPSTPPPTVTRPSNKANSTPEQSFRQRVQKHTKKASTFPKMMRPSPLRPGIHDLWTRKIDGSADSFTLQMSPSAGLLESPPPSAKLVQDENTNTYFPRDHQTYTIAMSPNPGEETPDMHQSSYQITPLSSPALGTNSHNNNNNNTTGNPFQFSNNNHNAARHISSHFTNAALSALQTPPSSNSLPMSQWAPDTPANLDFSFPASPDYHSLNGIPQQGWWTNQGATMPQPSNTPGYTRSIPQSQRHQSMAYSSPSVSGLGISCDTASFSDFGNAELVGSSDDAHSRHIPNTGFGSIHSGSVSGPSMHSSFDLQAFQHDPHPSMLYSSSPPTASSTGATAHAHSQGIHIGNPIARTPPTRSPTQSPTPQPRFTRRRHSAHQNLHAQYNAHAHGAAQAQGLHAGPPSRAHRRKSSNSSASHGAQNVKASVGFVNYTPHDSLKILTGVAPSGSSKTKARREKEAADKRRKLSQAAVKAVMDAGGDLSRLEEGGLLSLEVDS